VCGTAEDASGVQAVTVAFFDDFARSWDGHAFSSASPVFMPATLSAPGATTTSWSYRFAAPPDGIYDIQVRTTDNAGNTQGAGDYADKSKFTIDTVGPAITVAQAAGQADPTSNTTVHFAVTVSERATALVAANVVVGGTAPGYTGITVTGSGSSYDVAVTGVKGAGTVTLSVPAGALHDLVGNPSAASMSTDNTVTYDPTPPKVTAINFTNGGTSGKVDQNDVISVTFSEQLAVSTLCSNWSNDTINHSLSTANDVTVLVADNASNDRLTVSSGSCTLSLGTIMLGGNYTASPATFRGTGAGASVVAWNATTNVLTITLGTMSGSVLTGVTAGKPSYTPPSSPAIKDRAGNAMVAGFTETSNRAL
jgi:hypothetical protein